MEATNVSKVDHSLAEKFKGYKKMEILEAAMWVCSNIENSNHLSVVHGDSIYVANNFHGNNEPTSVSGSYLFTKKWEYLMSVVGFNQEQSVVGFNQEQSSSTETSYYRMGNIDDFLVCATTIVIRKWKTKTITHSLCVHAFRTENDEAQHYFYNGNIEHFAELVLRSVRNKKTKETYNL